LSVVLKGKKISSNVQLNNSVIFKPKLGLGCLCPPSIWYIILSLILSFLAASLAVLKPALFLKSVIWFATFTLLSLTLYLYNITNSDINQALITTNSVI